uniref:proline-rich protein 2-like n=1 Tax=Odobenus rosmarus divergens TaxID=9708 RepID=UPI00063C462B|nr:PREDICTED: proline-rich protein 2-like [Odobenus rosmarus divergens]
MIAPTGPVTSAARTPARGERELGILGAGGAGACSAQPRGRPAPTGRTHLQRPAPRPPCAHRPHSPAAPSSAAALRPAPLAARPPVARTPGKHQRPAAAQASSPRGVKLRARPPRSCCRAIAPRGRPARSRAPQAAPRSRTPRAPARPPPAPGGTRAPARPPPAPGAAGGTTCRAGFQQPPQRLLPACPLPGNSVIRPPSSRTRFLTHSTRWETFTLIKATRSAGVEQLINVTESK